MGITTKDLAQLCGVSRTTVHRALSGVGRIHPDTKERILKMAKEHDYRPDLLARGLVKGKTYYIGIVVLDVKNQYFAEMVSAIGAEMNRRGYCMNIMLHGNDRKMEKEQLTRLAAYHMDGIILSSVNEGEEYREFLESLDIPIVSVDNKIAEGLPFVSINEEAAMQEAVVRALRKGYQKLVFVCPALEPGEAQNAYVHRQRLKGFQEAVKRHPETEAGHLLDWSYLERVEDLVNQEKRTAFLCTADNFALDIMKKLYSCGKEPPEDYGIVGFDNIDTLEYVSPRLVTISNSVDAVAQTAVNLLFELIEKKAAGEEMPDPASLCKILPYEFIRGETL